MSLYEDLAICFEDVNKIYRLYKNKWQKAKAALGFNVKDTGQQFHALKNINLHIKKGERVGLIGRNGAGKTTLLKIITGNFQQTSGNVLINGRVQALMNTGIGFHPEFTGLENIKASLLYNGLSKEQFKGAVDDVVDFVELDEFLEQPFKTYSLGMQSRLQFAVATAIQPEILIVDEVLGAGDAYFSAKSAERMRTLTSSGCTLILVSHSMQQVLQFCEKAFWLECGQIIQKGEVLEVVKSYEQFSKKLEIERHTDMMNNKKVKNNSIIHTKLIREKLLNEVVSENVHSQKNTTISRWESHEQGLKIEKINLLNQNGDLINFANSGEALEIELVVKAEKKGCYDAYFMILLFTSDGRWLSRHCSKKFTLLCERSEEEIFVKLRFDELLLGNGKYIFSAGIYKILDLHDLSTARYYDLLSRSFELEVRGRYNLDESIFYHPASWAVENSSLLKCPESGELV